MPRFFRQKNIQPVTQQLSLGQLKQNNYFCCLQTELKISKEVAQLCALKTKVSLSRYFF